MRPRWWLVALVLVCLVPVAPLTATAAPVDPEHDVQAFGDAGFFGSTGPLNLSQPIVGMAAHPTGNGYWEVASDGGIFAFGNAGFFGSTGAIRLTRPVVGMAATPSGNGYWMVAADGGVFAFGDAGFFGSTGAIRLNRPIVGMARSPTGNGYWLVASDGGIFAFGDAGFFGSTGAIRLNRPMVGMAATPSGNGYWLVASDGGIFAFGDAAFFGSTGAIRLNRPIVGMAATPSGNGYWLVASDGGVFTFGPASGFFGSAAGMPLHQLVVGIVATPSGNGYWTVGTGQCAVLGDRADKVDLNGGSFVYQTGLGVGVHGCFERVTFEFVSGSGEPAKIAYDIGYRRPPFREPSGEAVSVTGNAFIQVRIEGGTARNDEVGHETYHGPRELRPPGTRFIREVQFIEDFEANLVWVIGLDTTRDFSVFELDRPDRLIVDIG